MAKIKYVARLNGQIVGTRSSSRDFAHAVVINGHDKTDHVTAWCARLELAEAVQRRYERCAFRAEIVPAERLEPKTKPAAQVDAIAPPTPAADPAPAASKLGIEKIYIHTGGLGGQASVHWTIGDRKFHVWMRPNDRTPEDVVHSNPVTPTPNARRDEHRSLDRTCKAQTTIWSAVWTIVERDDLIAKCRLADRQKRDLEQRRAALTARRHELEQAVIQAWRAGQLADSFNARELFDLDRDAADQIAGLNAAAADQVQA